jgi:hypothetical protein
VTLAAEAHLRLTINYHIRLRSPHKEIAPMIDATENIRRQMLDEINTDPGSREALEAAHGQVWDTGQLASDFEVLGFLAPLVVVRRRADGMKGSLQFQHHPRFYFGFVSDA